MTKKEQVFVGEVWEFYAHARRRGLPWRKTKNPYRILVSEIMLQQTQVDRVIPKYTAFIKKFPTVDVLAHATLGDVLRAWQGLGYNRRAKLLHTCAQVVTDDHQGRFPKTYERLTKLPGIGPYTAGAIMAFAFNKPVPIIETNIRTVYLHHFFKDKTNISDADILKLVARTLDQTNPREWYAALMDYGTFLKKEFGNPNARSKSYTKQSTFEGSDRQIRGAILRRLAYGGAALKNLHTLGFQTDRLLAQLLKLKKEGLITETKKVYRLPT